MADLAEEISGSRGVKPAGRRRMSVRYVVFELILSRAVPSAFFLAFLAAQIAAAEHRLAETTGNLSPVDFAFALQRGLSTLFYALVVALFIIRRPVTGKHSSPLGAAVGLAGTFLIVVVPLIVGMPEARGDLDILVVSCAIIFVGMAFAVFSLAALGRCFGIFPEARGLVTRGPYRLVRHPVYLGELISILGMVVATLSPVMLAVFLATVGLQYWRTINEEQVLASVFPEYERYRRQTPRLLPFIG